MVKSAINWLLFFPVLYWNLLSIFISEYSLIILIMKTIDTESVGRERFLLFFNDALQLWNRHNVLAKVMNF